LARDERRLVQRYATMALAGDPHETIVDRLDHEIETFAAVLAAARRQGQAWDPSVLWSADGRIRVQFGSPAQTTRNLLREGVDGDHVFVLPAAFVADPTTSGGV